MPRAEFEAEKILERASETRRHSAAGTRAIGV